MEFNSFSFKIRISRFASSAGVLMSMVGVLVSHWKSARAVAKLMRFVKESNTGPGVV